MIWSPYDPLTLISILSPDAIVAIANADCSISCADNDRKKRIKAESMPYIERRPAGS